MGKNKLLLSFSGGRSSAYMVYNILNSDYYNENFEFKIIFANTGKEHTETLNFVHQCEKWFKKEIIWLEAKHLNENALPFSKKGWKVKYQLVNFKNASRNGEPFEEMCSVIGIPCSSAPFCSDQLKRKPIEAYLKDIGWKNYYKAIGIQSDELDRMNENFKKKKY